MKLAYTTFTCILFLFGCSAPNSKTDSAGQENTGLIPAVSAVEIGIDTSLLKDLTTKITAQHYPNIHSLLIARDGRLFYEEYFPGQDQNYGRDLGNVFHADTTLHDLRSISKSIVSALIGIGIERGLIKGVGQKISDFFPEFDFAGEKANWTIEHFLTMTTGLQWNENVPYDNPENDEIKMTYSKDPVKYVLSKHLKETPGKSFNYNGGATQILAEIIERTSGEPLDQFAFSYFFKPLGIRKFEWNKYSTWGVQTSSLPPPV